MVEILPEAADVDTAHIGYLVVTVVDLVCTAVVHDEGGHVQSNAELVVVVERTCRRSELADCCSYVLIDSSVDGRVNATTAGICSGLLVVRRALKSVC